jgi:hypothetical protein
LCKCASSGIRFLFLKVKNNPHHWKCLYVYISNPQKGHEQEMLLFETAVGIAATIFV